MTKIQLRRDTAANWSTNNPTPSAGEPCFETDTGKLKIGDGITAYNSLPYQGGTSDAAVTTDTAQTISGQKTFTNDVIIEQWNSNISPVRETHIDLTGGNNNNFISAEGTDKAFGMYCSSDAGIQLGTSKLDYTKGLSVKPSSLTFKSSDGTVTDLLALGLEICDIGMALYVDETQGKRRYLNGQIVDINTNTQAFLNRLKEITTLHPSLLCTEEEWQTAKTMSAFGQVGKFVFNYADDGVTVVSVRIPRVVNVQGLFDLQNLGMTVDAGLPNITGRFTSTTGSGWLGTIDETGPFYKGPSGSGGATAGGSANWNSLQFDASRSSSIYGNSTTVQQEAIQYPYFIQIATGSETENNIINDIELNNPYSLFDSKYSDHELNNLSWLKSEGQWNSKAIYPTAYDKLLKVYNGTETVEGLSVKLSTETYTDYDFVLNTADETFRLPLKTLHSDDTVNSLSLYFYVGETVQNANLIDAGRIGEQLATKTDMLQASGAGMPSNRYIDLELGATGTTYTAPADGWVLFTVQGQGFCSLEQGSISVYNSFTEADGNYYSVLLPVRKGTFKAYYNGVKKITFKFIYAVGSSPTV